MIPRLELAKGVLRDALFVFGARCSVVWVNLPQAILGLWGGFKCRKRDVMPPSPCPSAEELNLIKQGATGHFAGAAFFRHTAVFI